MITTRVCLLSSTETPPPTPSPGPGRGGYRGLRASKMAQDGSKRASKSQDGLQDGPCYFKMGQDGLRHTSKRPQNSPKTDPSAIRALHGALQDAKTVQKPRENECVWHPRLFASDEPLGPQDGPNMAQKSPNKGPRKPNTAPRSPKRRPRALQDGPRTPFESFRGGTLIKGPPLFEPWSPRWPQEASQPFPKTLHPALCGPRWLQESPR